MFDDRDKCTAELQMVMKYMSGSCAAGFGFELWIFKMSFMDTHTHTHRFVHLFLQGHCIDMPVF